MSKPPEMSTEERARIEAVGMDFRAGVLPLRTVGERHGLSAASVLKWAKKYGWERDLSAKIRAKADAVVNRAAVNAAVNVNSAVSERDTIEANAKAIADVRIGQRVDIKAGRSLVAKLLEELRGVTERPDLVEDLIGAIAREGDDDLEKRGERSNKLREALDRLMSLPGRVSAVKGLAEALKNLIALEREAWGIDSKEKDATEVEDLSDDELDRRIAAKVEKMNASAAAGG